MLRGLIAALVGCILLYTPVLVIGYINGEYAKPKFLENAGAFEGLFALVYIILIGFLTGYLTRKISNGSFFWSFVPYLTLLLFLFYWLFSASWGDVDVNIAGVLALILIPWTILTLLGYWGWKVERKRQLEEITSSQNLASNKHLI